MSLLGKFRQFYVLKNVIGASLRFGDSGETSLNTCSLFLQDNEIDLREPKQYDNLYECIEKIKPDIPVSLHLEGRGILIKEVDKQVEDEWDESFIMSVFPNFEKDRYYYSYLDSGVKFWIALVQRDKIDSLLIQLFDNNINIIQVYIGPFILDPILKQLNNYSLRYQFGNHAIGLDEQRHWLTYSFSIVNQSKFKTKVGDQLIDQQYISAYAAGFNALMRAYLPHYGILLPKVEKNYQEQLDKIKFKNNSIVLLISAFVLLIISTVAYSYYFAESERLQAIQAQSTATISNEKELLAGIAKKELILKELGWNGGVSKAWLIDQLGISLNEFPAITIIDFAINPSVDKKRFIKESEIDNRNHMIVKGRCPTLEVLNSWTRRLSHMNWVDRVLINQFTKSQDFNDTQQVFSVEIIFNYDF